MAQLVLLGTGGTIATRGGEDGRRVGVGAADLLAEAGRVWPVPEGLRVEARDVRRVVSFAARVPDMLDLARTVRETATGADGVVVTHGTDSLEETAFLLALCHSMDVPVVLTGAQRPFDDPHSDGARNLASALRWAHSEEAVGSGVTVVFDGKVLPAVGVRKVHSLALAAFDAPDRGTIGHVDEAGVRRHASVPKPSPILDPERADLPRVEVVPQYLGADAGAVRRAREAGARGVVIAAFGSGNTAPDVTDACLDLLDEGVPLMVASRVGAGPVVGLYKGGGLALAEAGAIFAGDLSPWQARLLLASAIASARPQADNEAVSAICLSWLRSAGAVRAADPESGASSTNGTKGK